MLLTMLTGLVGGFTSIRGQTPVVPSPQSDSFSQGVIELLTGKPKEAALDLAEAARIDPGSPETWHFLGIALQGDGQNLPAERAYQRALVLNSSYLPARASLAYLLLLTNELDKAQSAAASLLATDPNNAVGFFVRGSVRMRQRYPAGALEDARAALRSEPMFPEALCLQTEAAVNLYLRGYKLEPVPFAERKSLLTEAIEAQEQYAQLTRNPDGKTYSQLQLQGMRDLLAAETTIFAGAPDQVYNSSKVSQRAVASFEPPPEYSVRAREGDEGGTVRIIGIIGTNGKLGRIIVIQSLRPDLTINAVLAAQRAEFSPAILDGHPVPQYITMEYKFSIY